MTSAHQVSHYWSKISRHQHFGYWDVPGWQQHQNLLASGHPQISWLEVFTSQLQHQGWQTGHALSLGCGSGYLEPLLLSTGLCRSIDACDLSPYRVQVAQEAAKQNRLPIHYFVTNLNQPNFKKESYDLIVGATIFHHITHLEDLFANLRRALKPNGRLLLYDYVGPSRFQWSAAQKKACNYWLTQLPIHYRTKRGYPWHHRLVKRCFDAIPGSHSSFIETLCKKGLSNRAYAQFCRLKAARLVMHELGVPSIEQFLVTDPSEAIRSGEILQILKDHFVIENQIPQGGTLCAPLLGRLAANFLNDEVGRQWTEAILLDERQLIQNGRLPSDLIAAIARAK